MTTMSMGTYGRLSYVSLVINWCFTAYGVYGMLDCGWYRGKHICWRSYLFSGKWHFLTITYTRELPQGGCLCSALFSTVFYFFRQFLVLLCLVSTCRDHVSNFGVVGGYFVSCMLGGRFTYSLHWNFLLRHSITRLYLVSYATGRQFVM